MRRWLGRRWTGAAAKATPPRQRRTRWCRVVLAVVLLDGIVIGFFLGKPALIRWQHRRILATASASLARGDLRSAALAARQALATEPTNADAVALLAEVAGRQRAVPEALLWAKRLVELRPGESGPLLALAQRALAADEPQLADEALARLPTDAREKSVDAHVLAGSLAVQSADWAAAENHFAAADRLSHHAPATALNLAALRLRGAADSAPAQAARADLTRLADGAPGPDVRLAALRLLLTDARARADRDRVTELATLLHDAPGASPADRLPWLEDLQTRNPEALGAALLAEQSALGGDPAAAATLARWMNHHGLAAQTARWLDGLPDALRQRPVLLATRAETAAAQSRWEEVTVLTADDAADWQELTFLRHALAARAAGTGWDKRPDVSSPSPSSREGVVGRRWRMAVGATRGDYASLSLLAELAQTWGWDTQAAEVWGQLAQRPGGARLPLRRLWHLTFKAKDTPTLLGLARRVADLEPGHPAAVNNLAWLLLLRGEEISRAHRLAAENFARHPGEPAIRSTAAYSLHLQGKNAEAAALLLEAPAASAVAGPPTNPALAACRGVVLAAAGRHQEAKPLLDYARQATGRLLPEERRLLDPTLPPR